LSDFSGPSTTHAFDNVLEFCYVLIDLDCAAHNHLRQVLLVAAGWSQTFSPPLGLLQIASTVRQLKVNIKIYDLTARPELEKDLFAASEDRSTLWIGFGATTPNYPAIQRLANMLRDRSVRAPLILGGIHATAVFEQIHNEGFWDAIALGEGEYISQEITRRIIDDEPLSNIPGLLIKDEESPTTVIPQLIENLDDLPLPAWDLINLADYQNPPWQLIRRGKRIAPLLTSRGCPYKCGFCAAHIISSRRIRHRSPEKVLEEANMLVKQLSVDEFQVFDDTFNAKLSHAKGVLNTLIKNGIRIPWKTPNGIRVDIWDREFIDLIRLSGGYQMGFGIESGDPDILRRINKPLDLDRALASISAFSSAGISTFGFFILGLPGETEKSIRRTIDYAKGSALDHIHVSLAVPYPGSELYSEMVRSGRLHTNHNKFRHMQAFSTCDLPPEVLRKAIRKFYLKFYSAPRRALGLGRDVLRSGLIPFSRLAWAYWTGKSVNK